jgi:DNA (cytosine-5)-methyltransferase 1
MPENADSVPRLLDLFCGAGGAAMGYHRAGFDVVGVDIKPQPNYPFEFVQADALEAIHYVNMLVDEPFAIHASPPCQAFTHARLIGARGRDDHPRLIAETRQRLIEIGLPYIIENVEGARSEMHSPITLCGSMFGLGVERHRLFEGTVPWFVPRCQHGVWLERKHPGTPRADGSRPLSRIVNPMAKGCSHEAFAEAMGIDWMPKRGFRPTEELREAIPPAFTEWLGRHLLTEVLARREVAA